MHAFYIKLKHFSLKTKSTWIRDETSSCLLLSIWVVNSHHLKLHEWERVESRCGRTTDVRELCDRLEGLLEGEGNSCRRRKEAVI